MSLTIVSGASSNHFLSALQLLRSIQKHEPTTQVYFYDLGLTPEEVTYLLKWHPAITLRKFHFENYPEWYDLSKEAGQYAWKPAIIQEVSREDGVERMLWLDAGDIVQKPLTRLKQVLSSGVYSPASQGDVQQWTHPDCLAYFNIRSDDPVRRMTNRNGAVIGFDLRSARGQRIFQAWTTACSDKDCIAPEGSHRGNHRQDQAVLSIVYWMDYMEATLKGYHPTTTDEMLDISIHNDCDDEVL